MSIVLIRQDGKTGIWQKAFQDQYPDLPVYHFEEEHPKEEITMGIVWKHPHGSLSPYPNLRCIASFGAGVDFIFEDPERPPDVAITRVVDDALAEDMSEYVLTAIMGHLKNTSQYVKDQFRGMWSPKPYSRISDHTIGIMGIGTLGTHLAKDLRNIGFKVIGWSKNPKALEGIPVYHGAESRKEFLSKSSVLVCLLPLTPETREILNRDTLNQLPMGGYLINVARGGHLKEEDLIPLLDSGHLSGACLDVFAEEPLPKEHPFWDHPLIQITPHVASVSDPASVVPQLAENYLRLSRGEELRNRIDLQQGY